METSNGRQTEGCWLNRAQLYGKPKVEETVNILRKSYVPHLFTKRISHVSKTY